MLLASKKNLQQHDVTELSITCSLKKSPKIWVWGGFMVFNATFNNISVISVLFVVYFWQSIMCPIYVSIFPTNHTCFYNMDSDWVQLSLAASG